ncbi:ion channel [Devosia sp. FJ2-5-3]|uniref:potassium channel family protein n=1 Tax=Devosia sp. FJ2-5-3 TaxID=2976680 RepID=UPI0023D7D9AB|nr:ion channel [Devosia sp. FJ2-5-3]WEJ56888.1 potassium channel family protein [Devosia sp. FJ2-5-3]
MPTIFGTMAIGTLLICTTVLIHIAGLVVVTHVVSRLRVRWSLHGSGGRVVAMVMVVLGLFAIAATEIWLWTFFYLLLGVSPDLETSLYLSTVTYSTVGYGDVVPARGWRLLAALEGVAGFMMIGWSTAYLVTASTRVGPFRQGDHF